MAEVQNPQGEGKGLHRIDVGRFVANAFIFVGANVMDLVTTSAALQKGVWKGILSCTICYRSMVLMP